MNKKQEKLILNKSNKNDILKLLGSPSTKSFFDNDLWIYIERKSNNSSIGTFNRQKIVVNNVLLLEINNKGLLEKKEFLNIDKMQNIKFSKKITATQKRESSFVYDFLASLRQKINDPLGKRKK